MPNVKPGDLCLVLGATTPGLSGRIVEVVRLAYTNDTFLSKCGISIRFKPLSLKKAWEVKTSNSTLPWITNDGVIREMHSRPLEDTCLIKIKDGDLTLDETSEVDKDINLTKEKEAV